MGQKEAVQAGNEDVFAIDTARVMGAGFLATTLGTSGVKSESLDIRGILASIVTLIAPMDRSAALLVGTVWHCLNGIVFAAIYAKLLIALRKQSTVDTGVFLGIELWILLMLTLPILFSTAPPVRSGELPNPGGFLLHTGLGCIESPCKRTFLSCNVSRISKSRQKKAMHGFKIGAPGNPSHGLDFWVSFHRVELDSYPGVCAGNGQ